MSKPSKKPADIAQALRRLVALMRDTEAEFPDVAWRVASSAGVDYSALVDAYDSHHAQ